MNLEEPTPCPSCDDVVELQSMVRNPVHTSELVCRVCYGNICAEMDDEGDEDEWDNDDSNEPVGSCENCDCNLYEDDDPEYCDQCLWSIEQNNPGWMDERAEEE